MGEVSQLSLKRNRFFPFPEDGADLSVVSSHTRETGSSTD